MSLMMTLCDVIAHGHKSLNACDVNVFVFLPLHSSTGNIRWFGDSMLGRGGRNKQSADVL